MLQTSHLHPPFDLRFALRQRPNFVSVNSLVFVLLWGGQRRPWNRGHPQNFKLDTLPEKKSEPSPDFNSSSLFSYLFTLSCLLTKLKKSFNKIQKRPCLAFLFHNFGQLIHSRHLTQLVDDSKQQQSVKNSDDD